jgi:hypothetical protein
MGGANGQLAQQGAQMGGYNQATPATSAIGAPSPMVSPVGATPTQQSITPGGTNPMGGANPMGGTTGAAGSSVQQLVTDYKQAEQSGTQLQDQTKQLVNTTLQGAGLNPGAVLGTDQTQNNTQNQVAGLMNQYQNLTGNPYTG